MTIDEAIHEIAELESTMPALPFKGDDERRSREMSQRLAALYDYVFRGGPAPAAGWKPSVPEPSEKEKDALRLHWAAVRRAEDFEA